MEEILQRIYDRIIEGKMKGIERDIKNAIESHIEPEQILNKAMIAAMQEVGSRFERQEFYLPEMFVAAQTMKAGLAILQPNLVKGEKRAFPRVAIGTVQGDLHDIGKNLVAIMLEGAGFEVIDLGIDVSSTQFVESAIEGIELIGISALLTTTMLNIPAVIEAISEAGLRENTRVIIGGAPVTQAFADQIGADGYAPDASRAVAVVKALLNV